MYYFAYGSNMSHRRLLARTPSAQKLGVGILDRHQLSFHKAGRDGSAKCDAFETGDPAHLVYGVVFRIVPDEKPRLDTVEGLGNGYKIKQVAIRMNNDLRVMAFTYYATHINQQLLPLDWYKQHVMYGAIENNLPRWYRQSIQIMQCQTDADNNRRRRELSVYS